MHTGRTQLAEHVALRLARATGLGLQFQRIAFAGVPQEQIGHARPSPFMIAASIGFLAPPFGT